MTTRANLVRAAMSIIGLTAGLVGLPVALLAFVGMPIPTSLDPSDLTGSLSGTGISDGLLIGALTVALWILWLVFVASVIAEVAAYLKASAAPRVGGPIQLLAASLVTAIVVALPLPKSVGPPPALDLVASTQPAPEMELAALVVSGPTTSAVPAPTAPEASKSYTVVKRDTLWGVAERLLGDPHRWREIYDLNHGAPQPGGAQLSNPDRIRPGWVLVLPTDADVAQVQTSVTVPSDSGAPVVPPTSPPEAAADTGATTLTTPQAAPDVAVGAAPSPEANSDEVHQHPSVSLTTGGVIGMTAATGLVAAAALARLRRRSRYTPKSPAPGMSVSTDARNEPLDDLRQVVVTSESVSTGGPKPSTASVSPGVVAVGESDGKEVEADVTSLGAFSVGGDQAFEFIRSVVVSMISNAGPMEADVVLVGSALAGQLLPGVEPFPGLRIEANAEEVLREVEIDLVSRRRLLYDGGHDGLAAFRREVSTETVVSRLIVTDTTDGRLQEWATAAGEAGRSMGIGVMFVGRQPDEADFDLGGDLLRLPRELGAEEVVPFRLSEGEAQSLLSGLASSRTEPSASPEADVQPPLPTVAPKNGRTEVEGCPVWLAVLGPCRVEVNGVEIDGELRAKAIELLAFLALHPKGVSGEVLATALWPEANGQRSRERFQTALGNLRSVLRRTTGADDRTQFVLRSGARYQLDPEQFECDLWRLEVLLQRPHDSDDLNSALALCKGPFADGFYGEWIEPVREQVRSKAIDVAATLGRLATEAQDLATAEQALGRGIDLDPYNEALYRQLAEIQRAGGRPELAISTERSMELKLDEIGLEPRAARTR